MTVPHLKKLIGRSPSRLALLLIPLVFACFALCPKTQAVIPAPDGGYPGQNTAEGQAALNSLVQGKDNTAIGYQALFKNTGGDSNTAIGAGALRKNVDGEQNTAVGDEALVAADGDNNTAIGAAALKNNTNGRNNTAVGLGALILNQTGNSNIALGASAGRDVTGDNNILIGSFVVGEEGDSNTIRIGKGITRTQIDGINGATASGGAAVFVVGEGGRLGTLTSSARFKDDIKPMDKASEAILALKPVSFRYKKEIDPQHVAQFGLVAEDVEKINPDLVIRDAQGRPQTVRYEQVNAMLLNEFLKEHKAFVSQQHAVEQQQTTITRLEKQVEALTAGLEKVSAQLEASKPTPQVVNNP